MIYSLICVRGFTGDQIYSKVKAFTGLPKVQSICVSNYHPMLYCIPFVLFSYNKHSLICNRVYFTWKSNSLQSEDWTFVKVYSTHKTIQFLLISKCYTQVDTPLLIKSGFNFTVARLICSKI